VIAIVDYGAGNLYSVAKALEKVGYEAKITFQKSDLEQAEGIILPGVGAFNRAMEGLKKLDLINPLKELAHTKPFLGICLGFQLLFTVSEENGGHSGLDIIQGTVKRFKEVPRIPHMGWNQVEQKKESVLFEGVASDSYFYFAHSYYVDVADKSLILSTTDYGQEFASGVNTKNIFGLQFHPEKSSKIGLQLLSNFGRIGKC
jgi:glutamine amidotransferase